jgi:hypothetical protein
VESTQRHAELADALWQAETTRQPIPPLTE